MAARVLVVAAKAHGWRHPVIPLTAPKRPACCSPTSRTAPSVRTHLERGFVPSLQSLQGRRSTATWTSTPDDVCGLAISPVRTRSTRSQCPPFPTTVPRRRPIQPTDDPAAKASFHGPWEHGVDQAGHPERPWPMGGSGKRSPSARCESQGSRGQSTHFTLVAGLVSIRALLFCFCPFCHANDLPHLSFPGWRFMGCPKSQMRKGHTLRCSSIVRAFPLDLGCSLTRTKIPSAGSSMVALSTSAPLFAIEGPCNHSRLAQGEIVSSAGHPLACCWSLALFCDLAPFAHEPGKSPS